MSIVAAVDTSERAAAVIDEARRLARTMDAEVHLVHVGSVDVPHTVTAFDPDREVLLAREQATGVARDLADEQGVTGAVEAVGLQGDPAEALLEYSREHDVDYVVVSTRERSPVGQALFGSVTQSLLLEADCPVVAVPHEAA